VSAIVMHGECIETMRDMLPDNSIDAVVTDPPYGLGFMHKAWDTQTPGEDWARECLRVLKPGGHLLAFGGTRTWHRLAVAVEDAGFEIRDSIAWLYGSGFPKVKTVLKPAFEPIVMGRKPFKGSERANIEAHGTGGLQVEAARIAGESTVRHNRAEMGYHGGNLAEQYTTGSIAGRWPANVALDDDMAAVLDQQSGTRGTHGSNRGKASANGITEWQSKNRETPNSDKGGASRFFYVAKAPTSERPKTDPLSMHCKTCGATVGQRCSAGTIPGSHPGRSIAHPTVKPLALMRWLVRLVTPPGGTVLDTFAGSGTTLEAAELEGFASIGIEREADYLPLIQARLRRVAS
jgi:site-specific DNA-methyltransferase (adenine-specific)